MSGAREVHASMVPTLSQTTRKDGAPSALAAASEGKEPGPLARSTFLLALFRRVTWRLFRDVVSFRV